MIAALANHQQEAPYRDQDTNHHLSDRADSGGNTAVPVVSDQQAPPADPQPDRNEWRAERDLEVQREMAQWTYLAMLATWAGIGVGLLGIYFVKRTLDATLGAVVEAEKATKAAEAAVRITRETGEAQTRAYLTVTGGKLILQDGFSPMAQLTIKNTGQSPAYNLKAVFKAGRDTVFNANPSGDKAQIAVTESALAKSLGAGMEDDLHVGVIDDMIARKSTLDQLPLNLEGIVEYQTVFGVKTGDIDMDTTFLLLALVVQSDIEKTINPDMHKLYAMKPLPAFQSGWIIDYRNTMGSDAKSRRERSKILDK